MNLRLSLRSEWCGLPLAAVYKESFISEVVCVCVCVCVRDSSYLSVQYDT